jgi:hypothetical protein
VDSYLYDATDPPIVVDDEEPDAELDAAVSDDDNDRTLGATPPPNVNDHHTSVPAVPAKLIANDWARGSATDSASGGQIPNKRSVKPKGFNGMELSQPSLCQENSRPASTAGEITVATDRVKPYLEAPASTSHIHHVFTEYEKTFGADSLTRKSGQQKGRSSSSSSGTSPVRDESLSLNNPSEGSIHDEPASRTTSTRAV